MIDVVLFDLDDTICEYRRPGDAILDVAFDRVGVDPFFTIDAYYAIYDDHVDATGSVDENRERCFAAIADEAGLDPAIGRAVARAYAAERDQANVRFRPGAREAVSFLGEEHALGIVTNGAPDMQAQKLDALGIARSFDVIVHAGYDAPSKPAPDPFHHALRRFDATPERAVHVGDSLSSDVAGAHAAGVQSVWVPVAERDPTPDPMPHYVLESLHDLKEPPWR